MLERTLTISVDILSPHLVKESMRLRTDFFLVSILLVRAKERMISTQATGRFIDIIIFIHLVEAQAQELWFG